MGWLSSLLNLDRDKSKQVFRSTHDAFALPQSSPVPDSFNPDSPAVVSYTYPPQSPATYGYIPSSSRPASLLPTHMDPLHTSVSGLLRTSGSSVPSPYPPLSKTWARIQLYLSREYPELGDTLNYGILPTDLAQIEMQFGFPLPSVVRESYLCVDGQEAESSAGCSEGLFFGLKLLPLETVLEEWRFWREVDHDPMTGANAGLLDSMQSIPSNWVRKAYSQRGWIPLIADKVGNYVGVDLNPGEQGQVGQVIVFGRDFDTKVVLWKGDGPTGWAKWLASFVEELESGEGFEIGNGDGASEDSEDDLGYEGYFYDGTGRGAGDGGGDGGGTGLKLTGEYRGWNVLEAWADRSLRKWHEAGIVTDADLVPVEELSVNGTRPGDLDIVEVGQAAATDIPIPILNHSQERIPSPPPETRQTSRSTQATLVAPVLSPSASTSTQSSNGSKLQHKLPTISVTKPPAPLPVGLPTAHDIAVLPSPPESVHSLALDEEQDEIELSDSRQVDLEAGRGKGLGLRGIPTEDVGLVSATRKSKSRSPMRRETSEATTTALLPPTPPSDDTADNAGSRAQPAPTKDDVLVPVEADLLMDQVPVTTPVSVPMVPLEPSPSGTGVPSPEEESSEEEESSSEEEEDDDDEEEEEEEEEESQPDTTIRLVGSGTESSTLKIEAPTPAADDSSPDPSPSNTAETASSKTDSRPSTPNVTDLRADTPSEKKEMDKAHKKNKSSLANLGKRFSASVVSLGGGKKKDAKEKDSKKEEKTT
ncbi:hypothetical protein CPB83DRAFT_480643 [Crepidotus variabilis]|uniref:Knr4/Smi1-like domain-containing protein n=1 Tax=Crepidotus variabilis TaxID=179855 RepID=A0A9P6ER68_9AGAR|nr:hypothetical protein CPB83DRAFT_480643 [Crepidotus variabilis]